MLGGGGSVGGGAVLGGGGSIDDRFCVKNDQYSTVVCKVASLCKCSSMLNVDTIIRH